LALNTSTLSQKTPSFYILNNSAKNEPIFIICVYRIQRKFHTRKLKTRQPKLNNVAALPCEKRLIWRCLPDSRPHTHNISTGFCQSHPLITGEDYYQNSVNWTLQIRHAVGRGHIDTLYYNNCNTNKACVSQGSAATLFSWCRCIYNLLMRNFIRILYTINYRFFSPSYSKCKWMRRFLRHSVHTVAQKSKPLPNYQKILVFCFSNMILSNTLISPVSQLQTPQVTTSQIRSHIEYLI